MLLSILNLIKNEFVFQIYRLFNKESYNYDAEMQSIVNKINKQGYAVLHDFYSNNECHKIRKEIDLLIIKRTTKGNIWSDSSGADMRCFAAEDDSEIIAAFFKNPFLKGLASNYAKMRMECSNTLAARIKFTEGNIGSGQGWHRDANNFQFKAAIYLSDVSKKDGPFQIFKGSHKFFNKIKDNLVMGHGSANTRFSNKEVRMLMDKQPENYKYFEARAGTVILFNSSSIHTGMPLSKNGERYILFNYYYPSYDDPSNRKKIFSLARNSN
jgi:hypothetical protein